LTSKTKCLKLGRPDSVCRADGAAIAGARFFSLPPNEKYASQGDLEVELLALTLGAVGKKR
jgi:hypothetical protein